jgi:hypothetical protein
MSIRRIRTRAAIAAAALAAGAALAGSVTIPAAANADSSWGTVAPAGDPSPSLAVTEPPSVPEGNDSSWGT